MNRNDLHNFFRETRGIAGWFTIHDAAIFDLVLAQQSTQGLLGDILEIGVFEGKSAVLLGRHLQNGEELYVCDIFEGQSDVRNMRENRSSYPHLSRKKFEENYSNLVVSLPIIHQCPSTELSNRLNVNKFRFIHIDGSHLYHHVKADLEYSLSVITDVDGIIALDDFRSQHTIGVTIAIWQQILAGKLTPLILTPAKMYLGKPNIRLDFERIQAGLESLGIRWVEEEILGRKALRTLELSDEELYAKENGLVKYVPPIALDLIRKSYLWKKFRSR
jgi:hypothetical protein